MLESLLIVLALVWTTACLAVGACAAGETIANVRRGSVGKPLGVALTGLLRSDSGWQWFALGAAWARPAPALVPIVTQRLTAPPRALCVGPPADDCFTLPRLASA